MIVSEWLLLKAKWAIVSYMYIIPNTMHFDEMTMSALY